jgi:hypothetical protein
LWQPCSRGRLSGSISDDLWSGSEEWMMMVLCQRRVKYDMI